MRYIYRVNSRFTIAVVAVLILLTSFAGVVALVQKHLPSDKQVEILVGFAANLFGTVIGATLAFWFALRQFSIQSRERHRKALVDTAFELHREFNNKEMSEARNLAFQIIKQNPKNVNLHELTEKLAEIDVRPIYLIVRFYQRLWLAIKNDRVDTNLVPELFGEVFYWWFFNYFESQVVPVGWQICSDIQSLKDWLDNNSDPKSHQSWLDHAFHEEKNDSGANALSSES